MKKTGISLPMNIGKSLAVKEMFIKNTLWNLKPGESVVVFHPRGTTKVTRNGE